jgi:hypothetical protein
VNCEGYVDAMRGVEGKCYQLVMVNFSKVNALCLMSVLGIRDRGQNVARRYRLVTNVNSSHAV